MCSAILEYSFRRSVLVEANAALATGADRDGASGGVIDAVVSELWRVGTEDDGAKRYSKAA